MRPVHQNIQRLQSQIDFVRTDMHPAKVGRARISCSTIDAKESGNESHCR
jgi:hypothetical protein